MSAFISKLIQISIFELFIMGTGKIRQGFIESLRYVAYVFHKEITVLCHYRGIAAPVVICKASLNRALQF